MQGEMNAPSRRVRGLSPIIATLILIAAALIGAAMVYRYFVTASYVVTNKPELVVEDASYNPTSYTLYLRLSNSGMTTVNITGIVVKGAGGTACTVNATSLIGRVLSPSDTLTAIITVTGCQPSYMYVEYKVPGRSYTYVTRPVPVLIYG